MSNAMSIKIILIKLNESFLVRKAISIVYKTPKVMSATVKYQQKKENLY